MATITDLTGYTWVGNDASTIPTLDIVETYNINYTLSVDTSVSFTTFYAPLLANALFLPYYGTGSDGYCYGINSSKTAWGKWLPSDKEEIFIKDSSAQTIQITGGTDATNATLIAWLQENGTLTKAGPTYKHYYDAGTQGVGTYKFRHYSVSEPLPRLATPTNVTVDGSTVSWDEVTNATSYDVYVDGTLYENTDGGGGNE